MKTCATCCYYQAAPGVPLPRPGQPGAEVSLTGHCRARPPIANLTWPKVRPGDWCGLHATQLPGTPAAPSRRGKDKAPASLLPENESPSA